MDTQETQDADKEWAALMNQASNLDDEINPQATDYTNESNAEEVEVSTAELLAPVIKVTGDIFAPNWSLTENECEQLGVAYGSLIDKYLPDNPASKYGLEISAVMITLAVFGSRKGVPLRIEKKEKTKQEERPGNKDSNQDKTIIESNYLDMVHANES